MVTGLVIDDSSSQSLTLRLHKVVRVGILAHERNIHGIPDFFWIALTKQLFTTIFEL